MLTASEIRKYLTSGIFGDDKSLDSTFEIDNAVISVVQRLDEGDDGSVSISDIDLHLMNLDALLNLEETVDWVKYAVQLPESVGEIFRDNHVTGSEFAELVDNNGELLETELQIPKNSWRKKLMKHIRMKLLGIGAVPPQPTDLKVELPHRCDLITLSWMKALPSAITSPDAPSSVFPVHSFRVQRRLKSTTSVSSLPVAKNTPKSSDKNDSNATPAASAKTPQTPAANKNPSPTPLDTSYKDVYKGIEVEFTDTGLLPSTTYTYRIQSWNAIGHSPWVSVNYSTPKSGQPGCSSENTFENLGEQSILEFIANLFNGNATPTRSTPQASATSYLSNFYFLTQVFLGITQAFFTLIALLAAAMRLKRGSTTSTGTTNLVPIFPWLWRGMNKIGLKLFGMQVIPDVMLTDVDSLKRAASENDISYGATGLAGNPKSKADGRRRDNSFHKHMELRKTLTPLSFNKGGGAGDKMSWRRNPKDDIRDESPRLGMMRSDGTVTSTPMNRTRSPPKFSDSPEKFSMLKRGSTLISTSFSNALRTASNSSIKSTQSEPSYTPPPALNTSPQTPTSNNRSPLNNRSPSEHEKCWDDQTRCNVCEKKFKLIRRHRHHCARCLSSFCHKHGRTTHNNFTSCKVPGSCICDRCQEVEKLAKNSIR
ncbi:hypothetical protein TrLO_g10115 [Triparma laevis f. longispina]|nr:hypothetical protein TrLO_g10115 [Triparma laevis f. longispina]